MAAWYDVLLQVVEEAGDLDGLISAWEERLRLGSLDDPSARITLASLYDQVGRWADAQRILIENTDLYPNYTPTYPMLGRVCESITRWGGFFTGTASGRTNPKFVIGTPPLPSSSVLATSNPALPAKVAQAAWKRAVDLGQSTIRWRAALANILLETNRIREGVETYEAALHAAVNSHGRWVLTAKHRWQFQLERGYHKLGEARVEDPLFDCLVQPVDSRPTGTYTVPGLFDARFIYSGLAIKGFLTTDVADYVEIVFDGVVLRTVNISRDHFFPKFGLTVKRPSVAMLPPQGRLEVRTPDGQSLVGPNGARCIALSIPDGDGSLVRVLSGGSKLDKKGEIKTSFLETQDRKMKYLDLYTRVQDFFQEKVGRDIFLMYGTLLGYHREGDFIPGDDDFDAGYVSDESDPRLVKKEAKEIIVELVRSGFTVSVNRRGRLFRVQLGTHLEGLHIDLRPLWFHDGKLWVHNHVCIPSERSDFLPTGEGEMRGVKVRIPRNPEAFLFAHYGPGWRVPDPGFIYYAEDVDPGVRENLNRALISFRESRNLADRIEQATAGVANSGKFISIGLEDLYPLDRFAP